MDQAFYYSSVLQCLTSCTQQSQLIETAHNQLTTLPQICHPSMFRGQLTSYSDVDWVAQSIYPQDAPSHLWPKMVVGDGNCLFRSGSVIVYGDESHHVELRVRTTIELLTNLEYYLNTNSMFNSEDNQLLFWLANYSASDELSYLNMHMTSNVRIILLNSITQAINLNTWVGFWHVIALASVLGVSIQSVYPSTSVGISDNSTVRYVLNRTISPRSQIANITKTIMWTSTTGKTNNLWRPNHFVPCLNYLCNSPAASLCTNRVTNCKSELQYKYDQSKNNSVDDSNNKFPLKRNQEQFLKNSKPKKQKLEESHYLLQKTTKNSSKDKKKYMDDLSAFNSFINLTPHQSCHFCQRLLFPDEVKLTSSKNVICSRCFTCYKKNQPLNLSYSINHFDPGIIPLQISRLNIMEKRMLSQIQMYLTIITLPGGQFGESGQAIHFPINLAKQWNELPRPSSDIVMIIKDSESNSVQLPISYSKVHDALLWLKNNNPLYKDVTIKLNSPYMDLDQSEMNLDIVDEFQISGFTSVIHNVPDVSSNDIICGRNAKPENVQTYTMNNSKSPPINILGKISVPIEELVFPWLFPYGQNGFTTCRNPKVTDLQYFQSRLMNIDRRFSADISYIFFANSIYEARKLSDCVSVALRMRSNIQKEKKCKITAGDLKKNENADLIEDSYVFMRQIRGTPAYWRNELLNLLAKIYTLGPPTWFITLSAADLQWPELFKTLSSKTDVDKLSKSEKWKLMRENPVLVAKHFNRRKNAFMKHILKGKSKPLGVITDYFMRIEFQMRGSPHIHMFVWVFNAPDLDTEQGQEDATAFIDKYVSTEIPNEQSDHDLHYLVKTLQVHHHTKSCQKKTNHCRFDFPKPCSTTTRLKSHIDPGNTSRFYITKRTKGNEMVNAYNPYILKAWRANMDIQMIRSVYGVALYVCTYICKSEPKALKQAISNALNTLPEDCSQRKRLHKIGSVVLSNRQISAQEVAFRMVNLPLVQSSISTVFLNTRKPEFRTKILKPLIERNKLDENSTDIFETGIADYYIDRPNGAHWDNMSLATFVAHYKLCTDQKHTNHRQPCYLLQNINKRIRKREKCACIRMPKLAIHIHGDEYYYSQLYAFLPFRNEENLVPKGETAANVLLSNEKNLDLTAIPYYKFQKELENAIRMLRLIESGEKEFSYLLNPNTTYFEQNICTEEDQVLKNSNPYQLMDPSDVKNDSTSFQDIDLLYQDTDKHPNESLNFIDQTTQNTYNDIAIYTMSNEHYDKCLKQATSDQQKVINVLFNFFDAQYNINFQTHKQPLYIFITGGAGTGKSFLINLIREIIIRKTRKISALITAPTGCAAYNINGQTLHSTFKLSVQHPKAHDLKKGVPLSYSVRDELQKLYHDIQFLIIDEISMVSDYIFHTVNERLNQIKCIDPASNTIFGGCSVIAFGDFYQLQPVAARYIFDTETYGIHNLWVTYFQPIFLTTNVRQSSDPLYAQLLNRVRTGNPTKEDIEILKQRTKVSNDIEPFASAIRLFPTRLQCSEYNNERLNNLSKQSQTNLVKIEAIHSSQNSHFVPEHLIPSEDSECGGLPRVLYLTENARVMLIRNILTSDGLVNGAQGYIQSINYTTDNQNMPQSISVIFDNPNIGKVYSCNSSNSIEIKPLTVKFYGKQGVELERTQFPLIPSYAVTIHKSQGLTLQYAVIDLGVKCTKPGQAYVALSRLRTLDGLALTDFHPKSIKASMKVKEEHVRLQKKVH